MVLETHHRGRYILVKTVTPVDRMTAILAIVEDEEGNSLMLQLFSQEKARSADDILSEGLSWW